MILSLAVQTVQSFVPLLSSLAVRPTCIFRCLYAHATNQPRLLVCSCHKPTQAVSGPNALAMSSHGRY